MTLNCILKNVPHLCLCATAWHDSKLLTQKRATRMSLLSAPQGPCSLCALTYTHSHSYKHIYTHINAKLGTVPTNSANMNTTQLHVCPYKPFTGIGYIPALVWVWGRGEFSVSPKCELAGWKTSSILFYSELLKAASYCSWDWNSSEATDYSCWHKTI